MVYYDDQDPPGRHRNLPYDPWADPGIPPAAPADDALRQAIREVIAGHPNWGPSHVKAHLEHRGYPEVPIAVVFGVKAGM